MRPECLFSTSLLYKILPTNLVPCKLAVSTFYTCYLRYTVLWGFFLIQTSHRFCSFLPYLNLYFCSFSHFFFFRSFWKHRRARSARTSCRFDLYRAGLRDFEKIEGMWTGYWPHYETCSWREFHNVGTVQSKQYAPMWYAE